MRFLKYFPSSFKTNYHRRNFNSSFAISTHCDKVSISHNNKTLVVAFKLPIAYMKVWYDWFWYDWIWYDWIWYNNEIDIKLYIIDSTERRYDINRIHECLIRLILIRLILIWLNLILYLLNRITTAHKIWNWKLEVLKCYQCFRSSKSQAHFLMNAQEKNRLGESDLT